MSYGNNRQGYLETKKKKKFWGKVGHTQKLWKHLCTLSPIYDLVICYENV